MSFLKFGDRIKFNWDEFNLFNGYYSDLISGLKLWDKKHKRHYITEVRPHRYFEYCNDYEIDNKIWVHKEAVTLIKKDWIDYLIIICRNRRDS